MNSRTFKQRLHEKKLCIGGWFNFSDAHIAEMFARSDFDWLAVDMEHSTIDFSQMRQLIQIIGLCQMPCLVRVGENHPLLIKKAMDAGADGIIVPMISNVEDVMSAVNSIYYSPIGNRGVGLYRAQEYGKRFKEYREESLEDSILIVQIENKEAVDNLAEILEVDEVDGFLVGPYDLSSSLGVPGKFDSPEMKDALELIGSVAASSNKPGGFHVVGGIHEKRFQVFCLWY